jgi:hypothetical protein
MDSLASTSRLQCQNCGANLWPGQRNCTACGAPTSQLDNQAGLAAELQAFLEADNQKLAETGTASAETGFGLGCSLFLVVVVIASLLAFFLSNRNWVILGIIATGTAIAGTAAAAYIANRARDAAIQSVYARNIRPEIEQFMQTYQVGSSIIARCATECLPPDAPLLRLILASAAPDPHMIED